jgi:hypothetical protein
VSPADQIIETRRLYSKLFLSGIPELLNDNGAYLSFVCVFAGVEALAGYRYPDHKNGPRFRAFIKEYFEPRFHPLVAELWDLRNSLVHSFSPAHFALCHGQSHRHFTDHPPYLKVLNAENTHEELVAASSCYFDELAGRPDLQALFERRANSPRGGLLRIGS